MKIHNIARIHIKKLTIIIWLISFFTLILLFEQKFSENVVLDFKVSSQVQK